MPGPLFLSVRPASSSPSKSSVVEAPGTSRDAMRLEDVFRDFLALEEVAPSELKEVQVRSMKLRVTWVETNEKHTIFIELPGVDKAAVQLKTMGDSFSVSGERKEVPLPKDDASARFRCDDLASGTFSRSFNVGPHAKLNEIKAGFNSGILVVTVPKVQERVVDITID